MPVYSYRCSKGHEHDLIRLFAERVDSAKCPVCSCESSYFFSILSTPKREVSHPGEIKIRYRHGKPKRLYHYRDASCRDCGKTSYVDCTSGDSEYDTSVARCDYCDSSNVEVLISVPSIDRFGERFPYYDRGLGMWLHSKAHRREMCKKLGVEPVDGDIDMMAEAGKVEKKREADKKVYDDLTEKMENHPGYAEYRRLKDRGWKPNYKHRSKK